MQQTYLEVTFGKGRPLAAYYYLPRRDGDVAARSEAHEGGYVVDYTADGRAIGIELTAPAHLVLAELNRVLARLGQQPVDRQELAPLAAA